MTNRGLHSTFNQIVEEFDYVGNVSINLDKIDNNLIIELPLFSSFKNNINLSLIYNHQAKNEINDFGMDLN